MNKMNKLTEFFKESNGTFSATRLAFLTWAFGVLIVWGVPSVRHGKLEPIPESVVVVIGMLMTGKVVQKVNEPSYTSTSKAQAIGETVQPQPSTNGTPNKPQAPSAKEESSQSVENIA